MVVRRGKKKRRGERTYHGSHKKWRGGGSRGGRGKAGMHKHKWSYTVKYEPDHFGKKGFRPRRKMKKPKTINLSELDAIVKEKNVKEINLSELGYDKLLGSGKITQSIVVKVSIASKKAVEKIEKVGGKVVKV